MRTERCPRCGLPLVAHGATCPENHDPKGRQKMRTVLFVGGPLDGELRQVEPSLQVVKSPPTSGWVGDVVYDLQRMVLFGSMVTVGILSSMEPDARDRRVRQLLLSPLALNLLEDE